MNAATPRVWRDGLGEAVLALCRNAMPAQANASAAFGREMGETLTAIGMAVVEQSGGAPGSGSQMAIRTATMHGAAALRHVVIVIGDALPLYTSDRGAERSGNSAWRRLEHDTMPDDESATAGMAQMSAAGGSVARIPGMAAIPQLTPQSGSTVRR
jgi:hypothetical protein